MSELPDPERRVWLLDALTALVAQAGREHFVCAPIVLPTPRHFPDRYSQDRGGVRRLLRRLHRYADLDDLRPHVDLFDERPPDLHGLVRAERHEGAAGLFLGLEGDDAYYGADRNLLGDPVGLTAALAHEVAHAFRARHDLACDDLAREEPLTDLTSVYLGFGVLSASASLRHRARMRDAFASEWSTQRLGYLAPSEHCFLLAAQAHVRGPERADPRELAAHLGPNQAASFRAALRWLAEHAADLPTRLGLPDRAAWPPQDSLDELTSPLPDQPDEAPAPTPTAPRPNLGRPVFRVWRRPGADRYLPILSILIATVVLVFILDEPAVQVVTLVVAAAAIVRTGRYRIPRCSDPACRTPLPLPNGVCPRCGGAIRGDILHADARLAAEEALPQGRSSDPGKPRPRA